MGTNSVQNLQQLQTPGFASLATSAISSAPSFINSVMVAANSSGEYSTEQQEQAQQTVASTMMNFIIKAGISIFGGASTDGQSKVNENKTAITQTSAKGNQIATTLDNNIKGINNLCNMYKDKINNALSDIVTSEEEESEQEQALQQKLQEIEEAQKIVNDKEKTPEERQEALNTIVGATDEIDELTGNIETIQEDVTATQETVDDATANADSAVADMNSNIQQSEQQMQQVSTEITEEQSDATQLNVDGTTDTATGTQQEVVAELLAPNPITESESMKLLQDSIQNKENGTIKTTGASINQTKVVESMTNLTQGLVSNQQGLGSMSTTITGMNGVLGNIDSMLPGLIDGFGNITSENENLTAAVDEMQEYDFTEEDDNDNKNDDNEDGEVFNYDLNPFMDIVNA